MKIQYISDIHIEYLERSEIETIITSLTPHGEVLILGGDIGDPQQSDSRYRHFLESVCSKFKKVFVIAGNHEFYHSKIDMNKAEIRKICSHIPNVSFLDNSVEDYGGYRWIGSTQWTQIDSPERTSNDFKSIENLNYEVYNRMHLESITFLDHELKTAVQLSLNVIVITHHVPIYALTVPKFSADPDKEWSQWCHGDLDDLVKEYKSVIKGWFYGHLHTRSVQLHHGVNFFCNPIGKKGENTYSDIQVICDI